MAIPVATSMTEIDTLPGEEVEFTIGDARWVMRSMADLYSDREGAVAREYSTNAYDEHVKFNVTRPIEVSLPTIMDPFFRVRDFAAGMSRETLTDVYTKFGESTKRDSNDFNGMLGFGSKSAIAYTTSFKVTSIHEGIKTIALVHRKPDYSIVLKVVAEVKSTEPSGVEVEVPVHNSQEFAHKAMDFYKFWLPGRVLVNGVEPTHYVGEQIIPGMYYSEEEMSYVVMGNVPYRIINSAALFSDTNMRSVNFVAYIDNGDVEFTPSREDLKYTQKTKDALRHVVSEFESNIKDMAQKDINSASDHAEAYNRWVKWCNRLGAGIFDGLTFGNDTLENTFNINAMRYAVTSYRTRNNTHRVSQWQVAWSANTLFVTDVPGEVTSNHKRRAKDYCIFKGLAEPGYILFTADSTVNSPWVEASKVVSWSTIKKELPRNYNTNINNPSRIPGSFDIITKNGREREKQIPNAGDVFYVTAHTARTRLNAIVGALTMLKNDGTVIVLGLNRLAKFRREHPEVGEFFAWAATHVEQNPAKYLSDDAKKALDVGRSTESWLGRLDLDKIDDPEFRVVKNLLATKSVLTKDYLAALRTANELGVNVPKYNSKADDSLVNKYPLLEKLNYYYGSVHNDVYIYINAAYQARKDNK